jgi:hypothetical protein
MKGRGIKIGDSPMSSSKLTGHNIEYRTSFVENMLRPLFPEHHLFTNWSAAVLKASRSTCKPAAAGLRNSRTPYD